MVDVKRLEDDWQTSGINLGSAGSGLADNYLVLYNFYKNGNKIKNLFLQIDEQSLDPSKGFGKAFHEHLFFNLLSDKNVSQIFIEQSGKTKYLIWKYLPFTRYIEFNNPYKEFALGLFWKKMDYDQTSGSKLLRKKSYDNWSPAGMMRDWKVSEEGKKYLDMIIKLAEENGSNIILYTAPYPADVNSNPAIGEIEKFIIKHSETKNLIYLNFRRATVSNQRNNFYNLTHLDKDGTALFMSEFSPEAKQVIR